MCVLHQITGGMGVTSSLHVHLVELHNVGVEYCPFSTLIVIRSVFHKFTLELFTTVVMISVRV